jgi:hypothetical protein
MQGILLVTQEGLYCEELYSVEWFSFIVLIQCKWMTNPKYAYKRNYKECCYEVWINSTKNKYLDMVYLTSTV